MNGDGSEKPKKRYECSICGSLIDTARETKERDIKCCKGADLKLILTQYSDEEIKETNLKKLYEVYQKELYIEETNRIDIVLATALSQKSAGVPIWLIIVGASGDMKSVQLNAIKTGSVRVLHNLTSKTLVNGFKDKDKFPDLAPELKDKLVIIPDMAQILKLPPSEKGEVWGQLRDLYDGLAGKDSGMGSRARYEDIKVTMIAGSTPAIDGQILVHQDLGTRELIYRTEGNKNKEKVMNKCIENEENQDEITERLKKITTDFLNLTEIKKIDPTEEILSEIKKIALYISNMRSTAEFDSFSNELRNDVYPEEPTRVVKQLKRLYLCLKSLSDDYPDRKALEILWHLGKSSCFPLRIKVFEFLKASPETEFSTSQISEILKMGKKTAYRECSILQALGLLQCRWQETGYPDKFYFYWKIDESSVNKLIPSPKIYKSDIGNKNYNKYSIGSNILGDGIEKIPIQISKNGDLERGKELIGKPINKDIEEIQQRCVVCQSDQGTFTRDGESYYCEKHAKVLVESDPQVN